MTYSEYLAAAQKINDNENVNREILAEITNTKLSFLYAKINNEVEKNLFNDYLELVKKYQEGCPLAYVLGHCYFLNKKFFIDKRALIPRPETEFLVEHTLELSEKIFVNKKQLKVLDLGTGSGVIAITLALKKRDWQVFASDISVLALQVARKNIAYHYLKTVNIISSDLFNNISDTHFDIIISNPPYISRSDENFDKARLKFEPDVALFAKEKGLFFYKQIFRQLPDVVNNKFILALEIGFDQKERLEVMASKMLPKNYEVSFKKDINDKWRYLFVTNHKV